MEVWYNHLYNSDETKCEGKRVVYFPLLCLWMCVSTVFELFLSAFHICDT